MTRGIRKNFSSMYRGEVSCVLCKDSTDDQRHLQACPVLLAKLSSADEEVARGANYDDIFRGVEEQRNICLILEKLLMIREGLLESLPVDFVAGHTIPTVQ